MKFSDIPAHESVKEQLKAMVDNKRIPHALLLEGRPGVGKFMMARALAQYIHCTHHVNGDSCGVCPACIQHQTFNHIDTHFSFPVIKMKGKSTVPVSDDYIAEWREFLSESPYMNFPEWLGKLGNDNAQPQMYVDESVSLIRKLNFTAHAAKYKIILMWLPERMNEECANKLLKLIEEPFADTLFILVSNDSSSILPTIYSRLRRVEMKRLPDSVVSSWLASNYAVDPAQAPFLAHLAEGSILEAMKLISTSDEDKQMFDDFVSLMRNAYMRKILDLRKWSETVALGGRERSMRFLSYCERLIGENFIFNLKNPDLVYLSADEYKFSRNFSPFINERNVEKLRNLFIEARIDIAGNTNARMVLFDTAVKVILLLK